MVFAFISVGRRGIGSRPALCSMDPFNTEPRGIQMRSHVGLYTRTHHMRMEYHPRRWELGVLDHVHMDYLCLFSFWSKPPPGVEGRVVARVYTHRGVHRYGGGPARPSATIAVLRAHGADVRVCYTGSF